MPTTNDSIKQLTQEIRTFTDARGWYTGGVQVIKGLAISISLEASELLEHFQWVKDEDVEGHLEEKREEISDELADVVIYAMEFADHAGIDLAEAVRGKMERNGRKYPV